MMDIKIDKC